MRLLGTNHAYFCGFQNFLASQHGGRGVICKARSHSSLSCFPGASGKFILSCRTGSSVRTKQAERGGLKVINAQVDHRLGVLAHSDSAERWWHQIIVETLLLHHPSLSLACQYVYKPWCFVLKVLPGGMRISSFLWTFGLPIILSLFPTFLPWTLPDQCCSHRRSFGLWQLGICSS